MDRRGVSGETCGLIFYITIPLADQATALVNVASAHLQ